MLSCPTHLLSITASSGCSAGLSAVQKNVSSHNWGFETEWMGSSKQALGKTDNCTGLKQAAHYTRYEQAGGREGEQTGGTRLARKHLSSFGPWPITRKPHQSPPPSPAGRKNLGGCKPTVLTYRPIAHLWSTRLANDMTAFTLSTTITLRKK